MYWTVIPSTIVMKYLLLLLSKFFRAHLPLVVRKSVKYFIGHLDILSKYSSHGSFCCWCYWTNAQSLVVQSAASTGGKGLCSSSLTMFINQKNFYHWLSCIWKGEITHHVTWTSLNSDFCLPHPSEISISVRCHWTHPKLFGSYWECIHKCVHCRCKTVRVTNYG